MLVRIGLAHGDSMQSLLVDTAECSAVLALTLPKARSPRKQSQLRPMDMGQAKSALVSADAVGPSPSKSFSLSCGHGQMLTLEIVPRQPHPEFLMIPCKP